MIFLDINLPHQAIPVIDFEGEKITDVNSLCQIISKLSKEECLKMDAAILCTLPNDAKELCNLAEYYNFERYGTERMTQESGKFTDGGYISYHGFISTPELLAGVDCERMNTGMQMQ